MGDVDGLHDLEEARRVLGNRAVPVLVCLHDDRGKGPPPIAPEGFHECHQRRLVTENDKIHRTGRNTIGQEYLGERSIGKGHGNNDTMTTRGS